jgi:hypothetical protein
MKRLCAKDCVCCPHVAEALREGERKGLLRAARNADRTLGGSYSTFAAWLRAEATKLKGGR